MFSLTRFQLLLKCLFKFFNAFVNINDETTAAYFNFFINIR